MKTCPKIAENKLVSGSHDVVIVQPLLPQVRNPADVRAGPKRGEEDKGPGFSRSHMWWNSIASSYY